MEFTRRNRRTIGALNRIDGRAEFHSTNLSPYRHNVRYYRGTIIARHSFRHFRQYMFICEQHLSLETKFSVNFMNIFDIDEPSHVPHYRRDSLHIRTFRDTIRIIWYFLRSIPPSIHSRYCTRLFAKSSIWYLFLTIYILTRMYNETSLYRTIITTVTVARLITIKLIRLINSVPSTTHDTRSRLVSTRQTHSTPQFNRAQNSSDANGNVRISQRLNFRLAIRASSNDSTWLSCRAWP